MTDPSLAAQTFGLFTDTALTTPFTGTHQLSHESDFSDNPQDFTLYYGSTTASRILKAASNPGVDQITLTPTYKISAWTAATAYSLGDSVTPTVSNGYRFVCTVAGTSHATTEPTWPTSGIGSTVSDNTVEWTLTAEERDVTEITLALTSGALATNTPGASLDVGTSISSGAANDVAVYIRYINAVPTVSSTFGVPELMIAVNSVSEYST